MLNLKKRFNQLVPGEGARSQLQNVLTVEWSGNKTVLVEVPNAKRDDDLELSDYAYRRDEEWSGDVLASADAMAAIERDLEERFVRPRLGAGGRAASWSGSDDRPANEAGTGTASGSASFSGSGAGGLPNLGSGPKSLATAQTKALPSLPEDGSPYASPTHTVRSRRGTNPFSAPYHHDDFTADVGGRSGGSRPRAQTVWTTWDDDKDHRSPTSTTSSSGSTRTNPFR